MVTKNSLKKKQFDGRDTNSRDHCAGQRRADHRRRNPPTNRRGPRSSQGPRRPTDGSRQQQPARQPTPRTRLKMTVRAYQADTTTLLCGVYITISLKMFCE